MKVLVQDSETTAKPLHDPFNPKAKLISTGIKDEQGYSDYLIEYSDSPYGDKIERIQYRMQSAEILVGANFKFDLHWNRRYGITSFTDKLMWDILWVQFVLNHQTTPYNSLNDVAGAWGIGQKLDIIKTEYWDKGKETYEVPQDILLEYQKQDVELTEQVYYLQYEEVCRRGILPLVRLHSQDLLMLEEMEWNGNKYNVDGSLALATEKQKEIDELICELNSLSTVAPLKWSPDFISLLLYGGTYTRKEKEPYIFTYKDGSTKEKVHWEEKNYVMPRLVEPPKQRRAKEGFYPTDEATLKKLKTLGNARKIVKLLLKWRELAHLNGTYLNGFPLRIQESGWEDNLIHTNYNQAKAVTGRLSSDTPNVQNNPPEQKQFFITRF